MFGGICRFIFIWVDLMRIRIDGDAKDMLESMLNQYIGFRIVGHIESAIDGVFFVIDDITRNYNKK